MSFKMLRMVEKRIVNRVVRDALAAGFTLSVYDGDEYPVKESTDRRAILAAMFSVDDEYLIFHRDGDRAGWVRFIYGNSGWDVVNDYTTRLEPVMTGATALAEKYGD